MECQLEAVRLAALIYLKCVAYGFPPHCAVVQASKTQLVELIRGAEARACADFGDPIMLWALFIGGISSLDLEEERWFALRSSKSMRDGGWEWKHGGRVNWKDMETHLRRISWAECLRTPNCMQLWGKVQGIYEKGL